MSQDQHLQALLDKIHTEGVDKANAEAKRIVATAETQAKATVTEAEKQASELAAKAERDSQAFARRATETVRQAARDVVLSVEKAILKQLETLLLTEITRSLDKPDKLASLTEAAVGAYLAGGQKDLTVCLSEKAADVANALRQTFAKEAQAGVTLVLDPDTDAGFRIQLDRGRVEHDFTATAITEAIAQHLRPRLAALLQNKEEDA